MKQTTQEHIKNTEDRQMAAFMIERRVLLDVNYSTKHQGQRPGQALMNALRNHAPELYNILSGTLQFDCFYNDDKLSAALSELGYDESRFRRVAGVEYSKHIQYSVHPSAWWETLVEPCTCPIGHDHG